MRCWLPIVFFTDTNWNCVNIKRGCCAKSGNVSEATLFLTVRQPCHLKDFKSCPELSAYAYSLCFSGGTTGRVVCACSETHFKDRCFACVSRLYWGSLSNTLHIPKLLITYNKLIKKSRKENWEENLLTWLTTSLRCLLPWTSERYTITSTSLIKQNHLVTLFIITEKEAIYAKREWVIRKSPSWME